ncbi:MAG: Crp/Fnr family transcriptional regulator [Clostridia bacterium]
MNIKQIAATQLFRHISESETASVLDCLCASVKRFAKDEVIFRTGEVVEAAGLVLSGAVHIEQTDLWGNRSILAAVMPGELFAEGYAILSGQQSTVDAVAVKDCEIIFFSVARILQTCSAACVFHTRLIRNLVEDLAAKNAQLTMKITHTTPKSIRGRVLSYLSSQAAQQGSYQIQIPFSRQQLADYLCVERSALSGELSKMQREGLITFYKNQFTLIGETQ